MKIAFLGSNEELYEKIIKKLPEHIGVGFAKTVSELSEEDFNIVFTDETFKDREEFENFFLMHPYTLFVRIGDDKGSSFFDLEIEAEDPDSIAKEVKKLVKEFENDNSSVYTTYLIKLFTSLGIIGRSPEMLEVYRLAHRVSELSITVLLLGESGTGKELFAKAIHRLSKRKDKPFIAINCGAIPENLLEDELFGHTKGAFTGAISDKPGKFEVADGGTLFLDEISTMTPALQVKLLRVLQEKEVERIGENRVRKVDVRVIAATNENLEKLIKDGKFREDLYYRINVFPIRIPPLRERREDIPLLATHILRNFCKEESLSEKRFSLTALKILQGYDFPGNVRELENIVKRAAVLSAKRDIILPEDLPQEVKAVKLEDETGFNFSLHESSQSLTGYVQNIEKKLILQTLEKTGWNKKKAAELLNIKRTTLLEKIKKYGLERKDDE